MKTGRMWWLPLVMGAAFFVVFAGERVVARSANCPRIDAGDVKYVVGVGYEYGEKYATITVDGRRGAWAAKPGYEIDEVCVAVDGGLKWFGPGNGQGGPFEGQISHVVAYTEPREPEEPREPTPPHKKPTPTLTVSPTPSDSAGKPTPTLTPVVESPTPTPTSGGGGNAGGGGGGNGGGGSVGGGGGGEVQGAAVGEVQGKVLGLAGTDFSEERAVWKWGVIGLAAIWTIRRWGKGMSWGWMGGLVIAGMMVASLSANARVKPLQVGEDTRVKPLQGVPVRVRVAEVGIDLPVEAADLVNGYWQVPENEAGWGGGSAEVGEGNTVIFAHNRQSLFGNLRWVREGSEIEISTSTSSSTREEKVRRFVVVEKKWVGANDVGVVKDTDEARLTLFTCAGKGDGERLVVVGREV